MSEFLVKHPALVCAVFTGLAAFAGFNAFRAGMSYADMRHALAENARAASEALGG